MQKLLEQIPAPAWCIHCTTGERQANSKAQQICPLSPLGHPLAQAIVDPTPESLDLLFHEDFNAKTNRQHFLQVRIQSKCIPINEVRFHVEYQGLEFYLGVLLPASKSSLDYNLLEEALQKHPYGIAIIEMASGIIQYANPAACELFQVEPSQMWGAKLQDFENAETSEIRQILSENCEQMHFFMRARTPNGQRVNLEANLIRFSQNLNSYALVTFYNLSPQTAQEEINALMAEALMESRDGILLLNQQGDIIKANPAFCELSGYPLRQLAQRNILSLSQMDPRNNCLGQYIWSQYLLHGTYIGNGELTHKYGKKISVWIKFFTLQEGQYYCCMFSDISPLKMQMDQLESLAHHDLLTGLPNRLLFHSRLEHLIQSAQRNRQTFALAYIDLDHFKECNDTFGHEAGDLLLQSFAQRVSQALRSVDTLARLGGDEFVLLLENLSFASDTEIVMTKIRQELAEPIYFQNHILHLQCSIGIAIYPADAGDGPSLLQKADTAMYRAKQTEGTHICYWQQEF